jgi:hypothetical protein
MNSSSQMAYHSYFENFTAIFPGSLSENKIQSVGFPEFLLLVYSATTDLCWHTVSRTSHAVCVTQRNKFQNRI